VGKLNPQRGNPDLLQRPFQYLECRDVRSVAHYDITDVHQAQRMAR
jgi:hypothetical protein